MTSPKLSPAKEIVQKFGGVRATARVLDINPSAVSRWMVSRAERGTDGRVPQKYWALMLDHARKERIKLTVRDLAGL